MEKISFTPHGELSCSRFCVFLPQLFGCLRSDDDYGGSGYTPSACESQTCPGKQKAGFQDGINKNAANEATACVTICHRTCSANNRWVCITVNDDAWGGEAASGCGLKQHNVTEDCNVTAKEAQSGMTADEIWGIGRRVDYLIAEHGTRETLRSEMVWAPADCHDGVNCKFLDEEKDYWFNWERACLYIRHGNCCGSVAKGACCGGNLYPNVDTDIVLKKYTCLATADCSGSGIPTGCEDDLLSKDSDDATKYYYTVENEGEVDIGGISMEDLLDPTYDPTTGNFPVGSGAVWISEPLVTSITCRVRESSTPMVTGSACLPGAMPITSLDPTQPDLKTDPKAHS